MLVDNAESPIRTPHAVVPVGQMKPTSDHSVVSPGQSEDDDLAPPDTERLSKMFDESRDLTDRARKEQQLDQDYYDGPAQLSPEVRQILRARAQHPIIDNRIAPAIDGILGMIENAKVDPQAFPRNPQDQDSADVCTKVLRYVADISRWQSVKLDCAEDYLKQGIMACIVEYDGKQPICEQIRWETFFYDPKSRKADFTDAKYLGIAKWMYADEVYSNPEWAARAKQLGDICTIGGGMTGTAFDETWEDRPIDQIRWVDKRRNRVLVVEIYYKHMTEWIRCVFCAAGWLEYGRSPYIDPRTGRTRCPIIGQSFKVDRQNNRYGPIRNMRPMQDEVNARRSRGLHLLNSRQVQNTDPTAPPVDSETVRAEAARADGVLPMGWQTVPTTDMATGNLNMLTEAKDSLSRMVPVAIAQDLREGTATSGRARQVAQQAGLTQFGRGFGRVEDFEERIYEAFWMTAQQFWTDQMYIRVTDDPRSPQFLTINEPVYQTGIVQQPVMGPDGQPQIDPATGAPVMQATVGQQQVGINRRIAQMDMDIIIGTTPDTVTLEQEVFEALMNLVSSGVDPFSPQFELLIEMSPLPNKSRVLERLKAFRDQQQQAQQAQAQQQQALAEQQAQMAAQAHQVATAQAVADVQKTQADVGKTNADAYLAEAKAIHERAQIGKTILEGLYPQSQGVDAA